MKLRISPHCVYISVIGCPALAGKTWGVFRGLSEEKISQYIENALQWVPSIWFWNRARVNTINGFLNEFQWLDLQIWHQGSGSLKGQHGLFKGQNDDMSYWDTVKANIPHRRSILGLHGSRTICGLYKRLINTRHIRLFDSIWIMKQINGVYIHHSYIIRNQSRI